MLFNSYVFLFAFLPLTIAGFYALGLTGRPRHAITFLILASLFFYSWWNPIYLPLLLGSATATYWIGQRIAAAPQRSGRARAWLAGGVTMHVVLLGYFKYANFLVDNVAALAGTDWTLAKIILPLAISFYTFQKIAYLVDLYRGDTRSQGFLDYMLFVSFFPQLIAGPIVHHRVVAPQFTDPKILSPTLERFAVGLTIFAVGLFKKVVIADGIAVYASPVFDAAGAGETPSLLAAWVAALSYTFQLYFDFSGYSDMAVGLGRLFGIKLPINFFSPYKATSIIDFWRRWHITLSDFLRDYVYIALGGNRHGQVRRFTNLFATMLIGGIWHGAGWTFLLWGAMHGAYLVINHAWRAAFGRAEGTGKAAQAVGWAATFLAVIVGWVVFRAPTVDAAGRILAGMIGMNGIVLPELYAGALSPVAPLLQGMGITFGDLGMISARTFAALGLLFALVLIAPNVYQLLARFEPAHGYGERERLVHARPPVRWRPTPIWGAALGVAVAAAVLGLGQASEFLYFQF